MLRISSFSIKAILEGGLSFFPWGRKLFGKGTQGTDSARYCYSVWLRHFIKSHAYGKSPLDIVIVELGPGDSLGIGLAALLSGAHRYIAVDTVQYANVEKNLKVFDELVSLFTNRTDIPANDEFPNVRPLLDNYSFPGEILNIELMEENLAPQRLQYIREALQGRSTSRQLVSYVEPIAASTMITPDSVGMVFSQAVLEHVDDLACIYQACHTWLKPDGLMSHQIDFKSHGSSREWNGHWAYPNLIWWLIRGRRPYLLNREPCSTHLALLKQSGFEVITAERVRLPSRLKRHQMSDHFKNLTNDDLTTAGIYILASKK